MHTGPRLHRTHPATWPCQTAYNRLCYFLLAFYQTPKTCQNMWFWSWTLYRQKLSVRFCRQNWSKTVLWVARIASKSAFLAVMVMITRNYHNQIIIIYNHDSCQNMPFCAIFPVKTLPFFCQSICNFLCSSVQFCEHFCEQTWTVCVWHAPCM